MSSMRIPPFVLSEPLKSPGPTVEKNHGPKAAESDRDSAKLKKACRDFEAILLEFMLQKMRESVPKSDLTEQSRGEEIYRSMLDEEISRQIADTRGVGLSDLLYRQLSDERSK